MITKFHCSHCGNTDVSKTKFYNGWLGYESVTCLVCKWVFDHFGAHPPENKEVTKVVDNHSITL